MISVTALKGLAYNPDVAEADQLLLREALRSGSGSSNFIDLTNKQDAAFKRALKAARRG